MEKKWPVQATIGMDRFPMYNPLQHAPSLPSRPLLKGIPSQVYRLNPAVAIEDFGERSLALHCIDLRLVELNTTARDLIHRLDGRASLHQAAEAMARDYNRPLETVLADVQAVVAEMHELDLVELVHPTPGTRDADTS
jgi:hypothetical protein